MTWFVLSLGAAFFMASQSAFMKRFYFDVSPWEMCVIPFFYAMPMCAVGLMVIETPEFGPEFWPMYLWVGPLTMFAIILHFRAIHVSPLSLTLPFLSFTPVFVLLTGDLILGETLSPIGVLGMLLVVAGGYVINLDSARYGLWGPIKAIWREPGSVLMLIVALIYAFCSVGGKVVILNSSPLFAAMSIFLMIGVGLTVILMGIGKASMRVVLSRPLLGIISSLIVFAELTCHNIAMSLV